MGHLLLHREEGPSDWSEELMFRSTLPRQWWTREKQLQLPHHKGQRTNIRDWEKWMGRLLNRDYFHKRILQRRFHQTKTNSLWRSCQGSAWMSDQDNATSDLLLMIVGTIILMVIIYLIYRYRCAKPTPEIYQPPSPVNPTFQATAPPSVVAPPSTSAQQVFVKYVT